MAKVQGSDEGGVKKTVLGDDGAGWGESLQIVDKQQE